MVSVATGGEAVSGNSITGGGSGTDATGGAGFLWCLPPPAPAEHAGAALPDVKLTGGVSAWYVLIVDWSATCVAAS